MLFRDFLWVSPCVPLTNCKVGLAEIVGQCLSSSQLCRSSPLSPPSHGQLACEKYPGDTFVFGMFQIPERACWWVFPVYAVCHQATVLSQCPLFFQLIHDGGVFILPPLSMQPGQQLCNISSSFFTLYLPRSHSKIHIYNHCFRCFCAMGCFFSASWQLT